MRKIEKIRNKILLGDALTELKKLPDECIDCVVTSPPYWGLRDYGVDGQLGLENTLEEYIEKLLKITLELKRVLKKTGVMFWNHGDCYGGNLSAPNQPKLGKRDPYKDFPKVRTRNRVPKCLCMQNYRLILKMIDEQGWILRNNIIWHKPNHMPSCLDKSTEIYTKSENGVIVPHTLGEIIDKNIKNLKILTPFGWRKIKNIWKVKKKDFLTFQFGSSGNISCSLNHRFPISHDNRRKNYEIKSAKDLRINPQKSLDRLLFVPIGNYLDGKYKKIDGQTLDYEFGKFIGLIVAEGGFNSEKNNQGKITLNKNENVLMNFFTGVLKKRFNQYFKIYYKDNYQSVQFSSKIIKTLYQKLVSGKCTTKSLDTKYLLNSPFDFRQGLFDGIIDGDGHIDKNGRISYASASKQLRDDVYLLASSIKLLASKYKPNKRYDKRTNKIYVSYWLTIPISLQKGLIKGERIKKHYFNRKIKKSIPAKYKNIFNAKTLKITNIYQLKEEKDLIDIEVEGGLFIINGGLVSHNSVKDRFANSYEPVFMLTKNKKYFFDLNSIRVPVTTSENRPNGIYKKKDYPNAKRNKNSFNYRVREAKKGHTGIIGVKATKQEMLRYDDKGQTKIPKEQAESFGSPRARYWREEEKKGVKIMGFKDPHRNALIGGLASGQAQNHILGKNPGDVWKIPTQPFPEAHFATFNIKLIEPMIKAGCPQFVCSKCGKPREKIYENIKITRDRLNPQTIPCKERGPSPNDYGGSEKKFTGYTDCGCGAKFMSGIVLDPFFGAGTTGVAAKKLGRDYIGIELNPDYIKIAKKRLSKIERPLI